MKNRHVFYLFILLFVSCTNNAEKYFKEAELLENENKLEEAIKLLDKAIAEDENYLPAYLNRGVDILQLIYLNFFFSNIIREQNQYITTLMAHSTAATRYNVSKEKIPVI